MRRWVDQFYIPVQKHNLLRQIAPVELVVESPDDDLLLP
jgi:hypothetical protein